MFSEQTSTARSAPRHLRVFLSSPGDVADERAIARRVLKEELPYDPFVRGRVTFDVVSWDDPAAPTPMPATLTPQEAVNRGLAKPSDCHIVVVILWSRMGTPLPPDYRKPTGEPYLSGTEWEYEEACSAQPPPDILVYRRTEEPLLKLTDPAWEEKRRQYTLTEQFFARFRNPDGSLRGGVTEYATPTDFKERLASDLRHILHECLEKRGPRSAAPVRPLWTGSPYPGLRAFTSDEAAIFFGRERETDALIAQLRDPDQHFLAVVGASGTGKSSLVRAGLLPRLADGAIEGSQHWCTLTFTPAEVSDNPFQALATELSESLSAGDRKPAREIATALATEPQRITDYAAMILSGRPASAALVLVVDQLEELFTVVIAAHRRAFINLLAHAASNSRLRVLATVRADFLPQCAAEPALGPLLQTGTFVLGAPGLVALSAMIRKPAERAGLDIEEDLVEEILKDAGTDPGVLPLLAFCLEALYRPDAPQHRLTVAAYQDLGRLRGAIGRHANALLTKLRQTEGITLDTALPQLFRTLIHVDAAGIATRRRAFQDELTTDQDDFTTKLLIQRLVKELIQGRLLYAGYTNGRATVEVANDALFEAWPALRTWLDSNRPDLMLCTDIAVDSVRWQRASEDKKGEFLLPKGKRLDEAVALTKRKPELLDPTTLAFIQASWACVQNKDQAEWERLRRESLRLAALAEQETKAGNAVNGILLALEALPRDVDALDRPLAKVAISALYNAVLNRREQHILGGHKREVNAAAFSPDGTLVVTASADGTARLWDATGEERVVLYGHGEPVNAAAFSPDGTLVVTASADGTARLWDAATGRERIVLRGHEQEVWSAAFSPDGTLVVTASADGTARLWEAASGQKGIILHGHADWVRSAAFSPDGTLVVTASTDGTAQLWDAGTGRELAVLRGHTGAINAVAFNPGGELVVTASADHTARLWDATSRSGQELAVLRGHTGAINTVAFNPGGELVVTASADHTARLWNIPTNHLLVVTNHLRVVLRLHEGVVYSAAFSPDGALVVTASADGTAWLWDAATGRQRVVLRGHGEPVNAAAFSPDGALVVTASADGTAWLWDAATGRQRVVLRGHEQEVWSAAFSPDGALVVTASADGTARLWDAATGRQRVVLRGHSRAVNTAAFSPNGQRIITASSDRTARLWDAATGQQLAVLHGYVGPVNAAAFSPDGTLVVTASADGTARLWNAISKSEEEPVLLHGHKREVNAAAFSPDGTLVATASADGTARLWDATGEERVVLHGHRREVNAAVFSPDGALVVTASADGTARLWDAAFTPDRARPSRPFRTIKQLIEHAKSTVPRELSTEQKRQFFLE